MNFQYTANSEEEAATNIVSAANNSQPILLVNSLPVYLGQPSFVESVLLTDFNGQFIAMV